MSDSFRTSQWGPETAEALFREVGVFKIPGGKDGKVFTLGDQIDKTPKEYVPKVMPEEKVFNTWDGTAKNIGLVKKHAQGDTTNARTDNEDFGLSLTG
ncbi:hypothetical protein BGZ74_004611 [Mortierella antarctica]|nr:hypothetical protein BGZ74_004611 [Mortierella antarctica]